MNKTSIMGTRVAPEVREQFKEVAKKNFMKEGEYLRYLIMESIKKGDK